MGLTGLHVCMCVRERLCCDRVLLVPDGLNQAEVGRQTTALLLPFIIQSSATQHLSLAELEFHISCFWGIASCTQREAGGGGVRLFRVSGRPV